MLDIVLIVQAFASSDYHECDVIVKAVDEKKIDFLKYTQMQI